MVSKKPAESALAEHHIPLSYLGIRGHAAANSGQNGDYLLPAVSERFPTIAALADANEQTVLNSGKDWVTMPGQKLAPGRANRYGKPWRQRTGSFPHVSETAGGGDYIASAVQSIAFKHPYAVVDGNVKRLLARLFCLDIATNTSAGHNQFKPYAQMLLDTSRPDIFNQAMMELGALVCKPDRARCSACPLRHNCLSHQTGQTDIYPRRLKAKSVPTQHIAVGVVFRGKRMLINPA